MPPTLVEAVHLGSQYLGRHGRETPRLESELLAAHALGLGRLDVYLQYERPLSTDEQERLRSLLRRCAGGEPVAYILGHREFHSLEFEVSPAVLIPRPETEELVEIAAREIASVWPEGRGAVVCDAGTGSGCIAISLLVLLPGAMAIGLDRSADALAVARRNGARHGVSSRVSWRRSDWLAVAMETGVPVEALLQGGAHAGLAPDPERERDARSGPEWPKVNVLLSNPPYVSTSEMVMLPATVHHEPELALAGGEDGLAAFRALLKSAKSKLSPPFFGLFEVDVRRADDVADLVAATWLESKPVLLQDLSGRNRFVSWWCR